MALSKYDIIKLNYQRGYWTKQQVINMVGKGHINEKEYEEIVGEPYPPDAKPEV